MKVTEKNSLKCAGDREPLNCLFALNCKIFSSRLLGCAGSLHIHLSSGGHIQ